MGRLANDCFASGGDVLRADEALRILSARLKPIASVETLPLRQLRGRVLAEDIVSPRNVPPHDNAAVDGYAVYFDDLSEDGETRLKIGPRIAAGHLHVGEVPRKHAARIFTGAAMPQGPDTVFMQEDVRVDGDVAIFPPGQKRFANRRQAGEDVHAGKTILRAGHRLRAADIGLIASVGLTHAQVFTPLKIAVFSTGDELREPGTATPPGAVYDSNRFALMALLEQAGAIVSDLGILPDKAEILREALTNAAKDHDAIVTSGGMSTGEEDHVRAAVTANGALDFWRLAIRPGRPVALGNVKGTAFIGLPGNPVAMIVTYLRFARPVLARLGGAADAAPLRFKLACETAIKKKPGRREWVRASVTYAADGAPLLRPFPLDGAGILTSLVESDGLIELAEDTADVAPGTRVEFLPFSELLA